MNKAIQEYQTLVFDCDGVVLNSNKIKTQAFYEATKHFSHESAQAMVDYHKANGGVSRYIKFKFFVTHILKQDFDETLNQDLLNRFAQAVRKGLMSCEIAQGLEKLKYENPINNWLIVSGGDQVELQEIFEARRIAHYFSGGIFGSPDTKEAILARELKSGNITMPALFLGDSEYDYQASQVAELDFVFLTEWSEVENPRAWCADRKISFFADLVNVMINKSTYEDKKLSPLK